MVNACVKKCMTRAHVWMHFWMELLFCLENCPQSITFCSQFSKINKPKVKIFFFSNIGLKNVSSLFFVYCLFIYDDYSK